MENKAGDEVRLPDAWFAIALYINWILILLQGSKLWGGRFTGTTDPVMEEFNASISYDQRMWKADIMVGEAHSKGYFVGPLINSHRVILIKPRAICFHLQQISYRESLDFFLDSRNF